MDVVDDGFGDVLEWADQLGIGGGDNEDKTRWPRFVHLVGGIRGVRVRDLFDLVVCFIVSALYFATEEGRI